MAMPAAHIDHVSQPVQLPQRHRIVVIVTLISAGCPGELAGRHLLGRRHQLPEQPCLRQQYCFEYLLVFPQTRWTRSV